jgi:hypothetical protein
MVLYVARCKHHDNVQVDHEITELTEDEYTVAKVMES